MARYYSPEFNRVAKSFVKTFIQDDVHMNLLYDTRTFWRSTLDGSRITTSITPLKGLEMKLHKDRLKRDAVR